MSEVDGQLDIFDALQMVTVHCFFARWCSHTVSNVDPEAAGREMESHYSARHYDRDLPVVYREIGRPDLANALALPQRIQRMRTAGWKMPPNTVYVGRPGKFGNPFKGEYQAATMTRQMLVDQFRFWLTRPHPGETTRLANGAKHTYLGVPIDDRQPILDSLHELRGKNLACWCPTSQPCHADVLLELANGVAP